MRDCEHRPKRVHDSESMFLVDDERLAVLPRIGRGAGAHPQAAVSSDEIVTLTSIALGDALRALTKDDPAAWLKARTQARRVRLLRRLIATDPEDRQRTQALRHAILTDGFSSTLAADPLSSVERYLRVRESGPERSS